VVVLPECWIPYPTIGNLRIDSKIHHIDHEREYTLGLIDDWLVLLVLLAILVLVSSS
jgi:hypothetical protein